MLLATMPRLKCIGGGTCARCCPMWWLLAPCSRVTRLQSISLMNASIWNVCAERPDRCNAIAGTGKPAAGIRRRRDYEDRHRCGWAAFPPLRVPFKRHCALL